MNGKVIQHTLASGVYKTEAILGRYNISDNILLSQTYIASTIFILDRLNRRIYFPQNYQIRRISLTTGIVSSVVGNPDGNVYIPFDRSIPFVNAFNYTMTNIGQMDIWKGNLIWIEDNRFIRILDEATNTVSNVFGSTNVEASESDASVTNPLNVYTSAVNSISVDSSSNEIYIGDDHGLIRKVSGSGGVASIYAGGSAETSPQNGHISNATFGQISKIKYCGAALYVASYFPSNQYFIQKIYTDMNGTLMVKVVVGGGTDITTASMQSVNGTDLFMNGDSSVSSMDCYNGELYFSTLLYHIKKLGTDGVVYRIMGSPNNYRGETPDGSFSPNSVCGVTTVSVDSDGTIFFGENMVNIRRISGSTLSTISHYNNFYNYPKATSLNINGAYPSVNNSGIFITEDSSIKFYNFSTLSLRNYAGYSYLAFGIRSPPGSDHDGGSFLDARFTNIHSLVQLPNEDVFILDKYDKFRIKRLSREGILTFVSTFAYEVYGDLTGSMTYYNGYIYFSTEYYILKMNSTSYNIQIVLGGGFTNSDGPSNLIDLTSLKSYFLHTSGAIYFIQTYDNQRFLRVFDPSTSTISTCQQLPFMSPSQFFVNEKGNMYFVSSGYIAIYIPTTQNSCSSGSWKYYDGNHVDFSDTVDLPQFSTSLQNIYAVKGLNHFILAERTTISQIKMECDENYSGAFCDIASCFSISSTDKTVCNSRGNCLAANNCSCITPYYGYNCELYDCYSIPFNNSQVCGGKGQCLSPNNCSCNEAYFGPQCKSHYCYGIQSNNLKVCSGHGICSSSDLCVCFLGFSGSNCSTHTVLNTTIASNQSKALNESNTALNNTIETNTTTNNSIATNEITNSSATSTTTNSTANNSTTQINGNSSTENNSLFSNSTNNITNIANQSIALNESTTALNSAMETNTTNNSTLQNNDTIGINRNVTEYNATLIAVANNTLITNFTNKIIITEIWDCFDISSLEEKIVCSGNGECIDTNLCKCADGFFGEKCNISSCYGKRQDDSSVCNGKGKCLSDRTCSCQSGYGGLNCESKTCFGVPSSDPMVCNGRGECVDFDTCKCATYEGMKITGDSCDLMLCKGVTSGVENYFLHSDSRVCSAHGKCVFNISSGVGGCFCNSGYYGEMCEQFNCNSIPRSNLSVCSGHGLCTDLDTCQCYDDNSNGHYFGRNCSSCHPAYTGLNCSEKSCTVSTCKNGGSCGIDNQCVCSGNFTGLICEKCTTDHYGSDCKVYCNGKASCGGQGTCNSNGECVCYSDREHGYWNGSSCNSCMTGYYGSDCLTSFASFNSSTIGSSVIYGQISNYFDGILFKLYGPSSYTSNIVSCSKLIGSVDLLAFGSEPKCFWTDKSNGLFKIEFDYDFKFDVSLKSSLSLNTNIFSKSGQEYIPLVLVLSESITPPTTILKSTKNVYSKFENIYFSGMNSFSGDRKGLEYYWDITGTSISANVIQTVRENKDANLKIEKGQLASGVYAVYLYVKSKVSKLSSTIESINFQVQDDEFPSVIIVGNKDLTFKSTEKGKTIKKLTSIPSSLNGKAFSISWQQTEGPPISFKKDSFNNLLIEQFNNGRVKYVFKVSINVLDNPILSSNDYVTITTEQPMLSLSLSFKSSINSSLPVQISLNDPENNMDEKEVWRWECIDSETLGYCGDLITQKLSLHSKNHSTFVNFTQQDFASSIKKPTLTLIILKGERSASSSITLNIAHAPPVISVINVSPKSNSIVNSYDKVSIEIKHQEEDPSNSAHSVKTQWKIDDAVVSESTTSRPSADDDFVTTSNIPSTSFNNLKLVNKNQLSSILVDSKELEEGLDHTVQVKVSFVNNNEEVSSSQFSNSFTKASTPRKSDCKISPSVGVSMKTDFSLVCENFQNEKNTIELRQGYIDKQTGIKIYLPLSQDSTVSIPSLSATSSNRRNERGVSDNGVQVFFELKDSQSGESRVMYSNVSITPDTPSSIGQVLEHVSNQTEKILSTSVKDGDTAVSVSDSVNAIVSAGQLLKSLPEGEVDQPSLSTIQTKLLDTLSSSLSTSPQDSLSSSSSAMASYAIHSLLKNEQTIEKPVVQKSVTVVGNVVQMVYKSKVDLFSQATPLSNVIGVLGNQVSKFDNSKEQFTTYESLSGIVEMLVLSFISVQAVSADPAAMHQNVANVKADKMYLTDFSSSLITSPPVTSTRDLYYQSFINVPTMFVTEGNEYSELKYVFTTKEHVPIITEKIAQKVNSTVVSPVSVSFSIISEHVEQVNFLDNFTIHVTVDDEDFTTIDYKSYVCINVNSDMEFDRYTCTNSGRNKATASVICSCVLSNFKISNLIIIKDMAKAQASKDQINENTNTLEDRSLIIIIVIVVCVTIGVVVVSLATAALAAICYFRKTKAKVNPYEREMNAHEIKKPAKIEDTSTNLIDQ